MFSLFSNLPRPVQGLVFIAGGASVMSVAMAFIPGPHQVLFKWIALGVVALIVVLVLFKLVLFLKDKARSGPFTAMLSRGAGRSGSDPAQKARMDDLRKKFEEGVTTFKAAGKDLYSLPWYLLVGPAGSGKTEALRHCNVGFPPGLQDCLQGAGGTLNMHWWFTNHSVVLDTAGRMFMTEEDPEWKQFLKMLKTARPRCPINGLLLVISSESLLKDSAEKIEQTAGAIARQLDVVQRTLDVRFPVNVVVTKCDKIIGFREFFESLTDPAVQHQILGWSNPASLDEKFDPATVDKHLDSVRQRLIRRRYGLLQNPVHTSDANARRTDQVDEMFELPDNLMRIAPRLRRYLEMIFVAGEWSPKPLFLRGIFFTSSMREGAALDVSLAQALGIDVEAIPGGKEWDKEKSYFLRDVFMAKVFREKGLVTRAVNVSKQLSRQRALLVGTAMAATVIVGGMTVLGFYSFRSSLGPPSTFWRNVKAAYVGDDQREIEPMDLGLLGRDEKNPGVTIFRGTDVFEDTDVLGDEVDTPAAVVGETARWARTKVETPVIAKPIGAFLNFGDGFLEGQQRAHRSLFEHTTLAPLLDQARAKLQDEAKWGPDAVSALAELVRVQTYALGEKPAADGGGLMGAIKDGVEETKAGTKKERAKRGPRPPVDADALFRYVLPESVYTDKNAYLGVKDDMARAVDAAYPAGLSEMSAETRLSLRAGESDAINVVGDATDNLIKHLLALGASENSDMDYLIRLQAGLTKFREGEDDLRRMGALQKSSAGSEGQGPRTPEEYDRFEADARTALEKIATAGKEIEGVVDALGTKADDPVALLAEAGAKLQIEMEAYFDELIQQLPTAPEALFEGKSETLARAAAEKENAALRELRERLMGRRKEVGEKVQADLMARKDVIQTLASMVTSGKTERTEARAYQARLGSYKEALGALDEAAGPLPEGEVGKVRTLTMDFAMIASSAAAKGEVAAAWRNWLGDASGVRLLDEAQRRDQSDGLEEAVRVSTRVIQIASGKREYEAATRAIAAWPRDWELLAKRTADLATERLEGDNPDRPIARLVQPMIPLSELNGKEEFDRQFHIEAARETMGDFGSLHALVTDSGTTGKRRILGADSIRDDRNFRLARDVTAEYAKKFLAYWQTQALEKSRASVERWDEFREAVRGMFTADITGALEKLRDHGLGAYDAVPEPLRSETYAREKELLTLSFAGVANNEFLQGDKEGMSDQLRNWKSLATKAPEDARSELMEGWMNGTVGKRYFAAYRPSGRGLKYWNDVQRHGVQLLINSSQQGMAEARNMLVKESRRVPLAVSPETDTDMTPAQVMQAAQAVTKLSASTGGESARGAVRDPDLDDDIDALLRELSGADFVNRDEKTRVWFAKLRGVIDALGRERPASRPLEVRIAPVTSPSGPPVGGKGDLASDTFRYARLYVNDQPVGEAFNLTTALPAEKAEKLKLPMPLKDGERAIIGLFLEDPPQGTRTAVPPKAEIVLPGRWHVLRAGLIEGMGGSTNDVGAWRVFVNDSGNYLWLDFTFDKDAKVPPRSGWPAWSEWPQ